MTKEVIKMKKIIALTAGLLLIGLAFATAQEQAKEPNKAQHKVETPRKAQAKGDPELAKQYQPKPQYQHRERVNWIDEDGDGILDTPSRTPYQLRKGKPVEDGTTEPADSEILFKDDDGDGIPNGKDEDWVRPLDGTGYQEKLRKNQPAAEDIAADAKGKRVQSALGKGSFRRGLTSPGQVEGAGTASGKAVKTAARKGRG